MTITAEEQIGDWPKRPWAVVGARLDFFFGPGSVNNRKHEVRAVVDDEYVVVRRYVRRGNKGWVYELLHEYHLATTYRAGYLTVRHEG